MNASAHEPLDTRVAIETPEHVHFHFQLAGPARRALAYLIDLLLRGAILLALAIPALLADLFSDSAGFRAGIVLIVLFVLEWGYFVLSELLMRGSSVGKRALGLRVVRQDGLPVRFGDSLIRNLLRAADFLPFSYALGGLTMIADRDFRRLGDLAAGTIVIYEAPRAIHDSPRLSKPLSEAERRKLPLHFTLPNETVDALELFLRRRLELAPARESELAEMLAAPLAKRFGLRYRDPVRLLELAYQRVRGGDRA